MNRRYFLAGSLAAASQLRSSPGPTASDRVRVACVGFRGFGRSHIQGYLKAPNVEIAALCDVDESVLEKGLKMVEGAGSKRPAAFTDFRKVLEDKSIDAVSIATPNHHHTLQSIWACQAGKDVYVEKPCSHNMFEAQQLVAAARQYGRMVQHGTGASPALHEAAQKMREGVIGDVYMARGLCFKWRDTIGRKKEEPAPPGVHYDLWLGPAPKHAFTANRFHYNWHWFWDYGNGDLGNQGAHQIHAARFGLGVKYPTKVSAIGGHFMFDDDQETPNTIVATFEFNEGGKKKLLVFEVRHWMTNGEAGIGDDASGRGAASRDQRSVGDIFYGSNGYLTTNRGYQTFLGREEEPGPSATRQPDAAGSSAFVNFVDAVRSRKREGLRAEIEEGAISMTLVHLANISYRLGRTLHFDSQTMKCKGDEEANNMFKRQYRAPFVVPEKV